MRKCKVFSVGIMIILLLAGCGLLADPEEEIRHLDRFDEEPEIEVVLEEGQTETMAFEEYIQGVVAGEMKPDWPQEAYGAQAILARSFALRYMEENNTRMISGAYQYAQEYKPEEINEEIIEGVSQTRGEALVNEDRFIFGWFHASAGGQTTTAQVGIGYERPEPPYTKTVQSPDEEAPEDVQNWQAEFSREEVTQALEQLDEEPGMVEQLKIVDRDRTGRVINLQYEGEENSGEVKAAHFRRELDSQKLKSTKIDELESNENSFMFSGSGYGHGVGMSQWGAYSMANEGRSAEEIVTHYFRNIELVKAYD